MFFRKKKKDEECTIEIVDLEQENSDESENDGIILNEKTEDFENNELSKEVYTQTAGAFLSNNGKTSIAYYSFIPLDKEPKAIIQMSHGMCEYLLRYEPLARELCKRGFIFCGNDHLGHGYSAPTEDDLGFTSEGGGAGYMVQDVHTLTMIMKDQFPCLPVILIGHSMGSFIARLYIEHYSKDIDLAVICGTGGPGSPAALGKKLATYIMKKHGENYRSETLKNISFNGYNKKFKNESENAWLTRDEDIQEIYANDVFCNFTFTARGFYDLFDMLSAVSKKKWAKGIRKDLPILIMSGDKDPVGDYGKGVKKVYKMLTKAGIEDVTMRLYSDCRHELFNELNKEVIIRNTVEWIDDKLSLTE